MIRLGILGSTKGTHLLSLIEAINKGDLKASIEVVLSNKSHALILERANTYGIHSTFLDPAGLTREEYDLSISLQLEYYQVDLVVLVGYMRILSAEFVKQWHHKVINVHPSLLPAFAGLMDLQVHRSVLEAEVPETGCTVHYVTSEVDQGPILLQKKCSVDSDDTADSLKAKVQQLEARCLIEAIQKISETLTDL